MEESYHYSITMMCRGDWITFVIPELNCSAAGNNLQNALSALQAVLYANLPKKVVEEAESTCNIIV